MDIRTAGEFPIRRTAPAPSAVGPGAAAAQGDRLAVSPPMVHLTGAFIQFSDNGTTAAQWEQTLAAMKAAGMDTVVIQFTRSAGTDFSESTEKVLAAADKLGMKVLVGTALDERNWYFKQFWPPALRKEADSVAAYTMSLVQRLGQHPSLAGVYIPFEVNGLASAKAIGDFYGKIATAAKAARPDLKVMVSPYTNLIPGLPLSRSAAAITSWWNTVLARAPIDILAWQDGVGGTSRQLSRIDHDLGALASATRAHGVELWADAEAFHRTSRWYQGFAAEPATVETLDKQMAAEAPYVSKIIGFDFNHYLDPAAGSAQARLYSDYVKRLQQ